MLKRLIPAIASCVLLSGPAIASPIQDSPADNTDRCATLERERTELRGQRSAAVRRRAGGFLAGVADRALAYAPSINVGDNHLSRAAAQSIESEAHQQARSGLAAAEADGREAEPASAGDRLREIEAERARLSCASS